VNPPADQITLEMDTSFGHFSSQSSKLWPRVSLPSAICMV
jgi:hypothetical protein